MTISKKLFLAIAVLATCVSSIKVYAAYEDSKNCVALLPIMTLGSYIAVKGAKDLMNAERVKKITPSSETLQRAIARSSRNGRAKLAVGTLTAIPHAVVLLTTIYQDHRKQQQENDLSAVIS